MHAIQSFFFDQIQALGRPWGQAIEKHYPAAETYWKDPDLQLKLIKKALLPATLKIDWTRCLASPGSRVLDLGSGSGWLSAILSRYEHVERVDSVDADHEILREMQPKITALLDGQRAKIHRIAGLMSPLPMPDETYDLIVASSSIHHVQNLFSTLSDLRRVLKSCGLLVLLNETPRSYEEYLEYSMTMVYRILDRISGRVSSELEEALSANGILYDAALGDVAYSYYHYHNALIQTQFRYGVVFSGVQTNALDLVHFFCCRDTAGEALLDGVGARSVPPALLDQVSPNVRDRVEQILNVAGRGIDYHEQLKFYTQQSAGA